MQSIYWILNNPMSLFQNGIVWFVQILKPLSSRVMQVAWISKISLTMQSRAAMKKIITNKSEMETPTWVVNFRLRLLKCLGQLQFTNSPFTCCCRCCVWGSFDAGDDDITALRAEGESTANDPQFNDNFNNFHYPNFHFSRPDSLFFWHNKIFKFWISQKKLSSTLFSFSVF